MMDLRNLSLATVAASILMKHEGDCGFVLKNETQTVVEQLRKLLKKNKLDVCPDYDKISYYDFAHEAILYARAVLMQKHLKHQNFDFLDRNGKDSIRCFIDNEDLLQD